MGTFGSKCVRCGKSLPNDRTGAARTCADCAQHLHGKLETERRCPKDGTKMTLETVWNILVERCPVCHSVWLEAISPPPATHRALLAPPASLENSLHSMLMLTYLPAA